MAEAELHIIVKRAGDPEKLGALVNAAYAMIGDGIVRAVVPAGYRCQECWRDDGGHDTGCSLNSAPREGRQHEGSGSNG